jgi:hypothetical protein
MSHPNIISVVILLVGAAVAMLLYLVALAALKVKQMRIARSVQLSAIALAVALYVISPLAYAAVVGLLFKRKGIDYIAVDLAWWVELAPCLFAIVAVALAQSLCRRRLVNRHSALN